jgi:hypothetical protein
LKTKLKRQVAECFEEVSSDFAKFNGSIKQTVQDGSIKEKRGDLSMKKTKNAVRDELQRLQQRLFAF